MRGLMMAALGAAMLVASPAMAAVSMTSVAAPETYSGPFTFDFDSNVPSFSGTNAGIVTPPTTYDHAVPVGSEGNYFAVLGGGSADILFDLDSVGSVSFLWGSIDSFNSLQFIDRAGNAIGDLFTGAMMTDPANPTGNQSAAATNRLVTYSFTGADAANVGGMRVKSGTNSFELDSINVAAAVPEPSTWALMMVGFAATGAMMRRSKRRTAIALA